MSGNHDIGSWRVWASVGLFAFAGVWICFPHAVGAIWPSVVALGVAVLMRRVLTGLLLGAVAGAWMLAEGNPLVAAVTLVEVHLLPHFGSSWKVGALIFTLLLGGFVALLEKGGTLLALVHRAKWSRSRRGVESGAMLFGIGCFFDGLANALLLGRIFKPIADKVGLPRVRLAYIVDTTSSAVACLAFISTWIAYQMSMIREGYGLAGRLNEAEPYRLFFSSIPLNFYPWLALGLLGWTIWRGRDFGPMAVCMNDDVAASMAKWKGESRKEEGESGKEEVGKLGAWRALLPLGVLVVGILLGIYVDGKRQMGVSVWEWNWTDTAEAFSAANTPMVLILASVVAALVAGACYPAEVARRNPRAHVFLHGMQDLFQPVLILVGAWMLSSVLSGLGAADVLSQMLSDRLSPSLLPVTVFVIGALIAFATGSSWGTMGILMPLAIPVTFALAGDWTSADLDILMAGVVGAVFSGAVFGDHCSPISDTTIVSSIACDVEPYDHVRTQMPYALVAAVVAALFGFLPLGLFPRLALIWLPVAAIAMVAGLELRVPGANHTPPNHTPESARG